MELIKEYYQIDETSFNNVDVTQVRVYEKSDGKELIWYSEEFSFELYGDIFVKNKHSCDFEHETEGFKKSKNELVQMESVGAFENIELKIDGYCLNACDLSKNVVMELWGK